MISFPYIDIIQNAPAPWVVVFGLAHVAIGWVIYTIAKDLYLKAVEQMKITEYFVRDSKQQRMIRKTTEETKAPKIFIFAPYIAKIIVFFLCWAIIYATKIKYIANSPPP